MLKYGPNIFWISAGGEDLDELSDWEEVESKVLGTGRTNPPFWRR